MTTAQRLQTTLSETQSLLASEWPEMLELISVSNNVQPVPQTGITTKDEQDTAEISREERVQLAEKLRMVATLAPGQLDEVTATELARQLSFATALPVSFSLGGQQLSHHHGTCTTMPDELTPLLPIWPGTTRAEKHFFVHVPVSDVRSSLQSEWQQPWCMFQRVLVIHPASMRAVVAVVTGILTERINRYQFGVSKQVAEQSGMWSMGGAGRAVMCLLSTNIPAGTTYNLLEPIH